MTQITLRYQGTLVKDERLNNLIFEGVCYMEHQHHHYSLIWKDNDYLGQGQSLFRLIDPAYLSFKANEPIIELLIDFPFEEDYFQLFNVYQQFSQQHPAQGGIWLDYLINPTTVTTAFKDKNNSFSSVRDRIPRGINSVFIQANSNELPDETIVKARWCRYHHPEFKEPYEAFITFDVYGFSSIVEIKDDMNITLMSNEQMKSIHAETPFSNKHESPILLLLSTEMEQPLITLIHPGLPLYLSYIPYQPELYKKQINGQEAKALGLTTARLF